MTMNVLLTKDQIAEARDRIVAQGLSALDPPLRGFARKFGLASGVGVGDMVKSWDVDAAISYVRAHVAKDAPVADIGSYASEVPVALHKAGYTNITGIDLNPELGRMPFADSIRYQICDFTKTPFPSASFAAITSISVIEHGFDADKLMQEMARLLKPGGFFFASFDYWPEKIPTGDTKFFGMSWLIFSKQDVQSLIARAEKYGLHAAGDLVFEAKDRPIDCGGKQYTFAYLILQKAPATDQ